MADHLKINGHSHVLPEPGDIPAFMRDEKIFWISGDKSFMRQGDWKRPITSPSFFVNEKIEWMEQNGIDHAVVLTLSQLYGNGISENHLHDVHRFQNDFNASLQADYPNKFTSGFVVDPTGSDKALHEMERCVNDLGLNMLCLPTHFQKGEKWTSIFEDSSSPVLELANQMNLAIEIHPYDGEKFISLENKAWRFHLVWMLAQCADAYHFLTLNNIPNKYPNIRFCFAHGAQLAQMNIGRRIQGFKGRPDLFEGMEDPSALVGHENVYFDTLVHDKLALKLLIDRQGASQVVFGLDDPYPLGEMDTDYSVPGQVLEDALSDGLITNQDAIAICNDNVSRWLYNDRDAIRNQLGNT